MRKYFIILFVVFFSLFITSCANSSTGDKYPGYGKVPDNFVIGDYMIEEEVKLTCIAHSDNDYYEAWTDLVYEYHGAFNYYNNFYPLKTNNRLTINAPKGLDFEISLLNEENEVVYTNRPNSFGVCYLFPNWYSFNYKIRVKYVEKDTHEEVIAEYNIAEKITLDIKSVKVEKEIIDLMFVVDTTTSMTDELEYLKEEISDVVQRVSSFNSCLVNVAVLLYKDKGEIYMINRAERLVDIVTLMRNNRLEPKEIRFVHSKQNESPTLVLVKAVKNAGEFLKIEKPLIIYNEDGSYTDEILEIYNKK